MQEYSKGETYLVQDLVRVKKVKVLEVTETSYKVRFENGRVWWYTKKDFSLTYTFLEHLQHPFYKSLLEWRVA
jgi:hypothetical protein